MPQLDRQLDWTLLRAFVAVMRGGSLSAAGRSLNLTQPTLGRQIKALEDTLGEALFDRSPNGLRPTQHALAVFKHVTALDDAAARLSAALADDTDAAAGIVRITACESFGARVIAPAVADVVAEHPEIEIEFSATNQPENLLRRDADIAIWLVRPEQEELIAQRIGSIEFGFYATRGYIARHGLPAEIRELAAHRLIGPDCETAALPRVNHWGDGNRRRLFSFRTDSRMAQEAAVHAGIGIGVLAAFEVPPDCDLVHILPEIVVEKLPVWLAAHADIRHSRRLRLVHEALAAGLRRLCR